MGGLARGFAGCGRFGLALRKGSVDGEVSEDGFQGFAVVEADRAGGVG